MKLSLFKSKKNNSYEFFLKNGASFTLEDVNELSVDSSEGLITKITIEGSNSKDKILYIDIGDISCIIKRIT